jgi:mono/diheme cytochrome c family protein
MTETVHDVRRSRASPSLALGLSLLAVGCSVNLPGKPKETDAKPTFEALYRENCAGCHGADGTLGPAPPLNDPIFLAIVDVGDLQMTIQDGRKDTPMPAFSRDRGGPLDDKQIDMLARGIKAKWADPAIKVKGIPPYYSEDDKRTPDLKRGQEVFDLACAVCHGEYGRGSEGMAGKINDRAFLGLISDQALRRYSITGRPDVNMPDFRTLKARTDKFSPLTSEDIDNLVGLLADWRRGGSK